MQPTTFSNCFPTSSSRLPDLTERSIEQRSSIGNRNLPLEGHFLEIAAKFLYDKEIIDSNLNVKNLTKSFPVLSKEVLLSIIVEFTKPRILRTEGDSGYAITYTLLEIYEDLRKDFPCDEVEIVGSAVFWLLFPMLQTLLNELGLNDEDCFLTEPLIKKWKTEPQDLDIRFVLPKSWTESKMKNAANRIKQFLATRLPNDIPPKNKNNYFFNFGLLKYYAKHGKKNQFAILSFGDRQGKSVDVMCKKSLKNESLFIDSALKLPVKVLLEHLLTRKNDIPFLKEQIREGSANFNIVAQCTQGNSWQTVIVDRLLRTMRCLKPKEINFGGWSILLSNYVRGSRAYDNAIEGIFFQTLKDWTYRKHNSPTSRVRLTLLEKVVAELKKALENHHKIGDKAAAFALTFNACLSLKQYSPELVDAVWEAMKAIFQDSENVHIQKLIKQREKGLSFKECVSLMQLEILLSLCGNEPLNSVSFLIHAEHPAIQFEIEGSFLLFHFDPINSLKILSQVNNNETLNEINSIIQKSTFLFSKRCLNKQELIGVAYDLIDSNKIELMSLGALFVLGCKSKKTCKGIPLQLAMNLAQLMKEDTSLLASKLWGKLKPTGEQSSLFFKELSHSRPDLAIELFLTQKTINNGHLLEVSKIYRKIKATKDQGFEKFLPKIQQLAVTLMEKMPLELSDKAASFFVEVCEDFYKNSEYSFLLNVLAKLVINKKIEIPWFEWWKKSLYLEKKSQVWEIFKPIAQNINEVQCRELMSLYRNVDNLPEDCVLHLIPYSSEADHQNLLSLLKEKILSEDPVIFCSSLKLFKNSVEVQKCVSDLFPKEDPIPFLAKCLQYYVQPQNTTSKREFLFLLESFLQFAHFSKEEDWVRYLDHATSFLDKLPRAYLETFPEVFDLAFAVAVRLFQNSPQLIFKYWSIFQDGLKICRLPHVDFFNKLFMNKVDFQLIVSLFEIREFFARETVDFPKNAFKYVYEHLQCLLGLIDEFTLLINPHYKPNLNSLQSFIDCSNLFLKKNNKVACSLGCALKIATLDGLETGSPWTPKEWALCLAEKGFFRESHSLWNLLAPPRQETLKYIESCAKNDPIVALEFLKSKLSTIKRFIPTIIKISMHCKGEREALLPVILESCLSWISGTTILSKDFLEVFQGFFVKMVGAQNIRLSSRILELSSRNSFDEEGKALLPEFWMFCWKIAFDSSDRISIWKKFEELKVALHFKKEDIQWLLESYKKEFALPESYWIFLIQQVVLRIDKNLNEIALKAIEEKVLEGGSSKEFFAECISLMTSSLQIQNLVGRFCSRSQSIEIFKHFLAKQSNKCSKISVQVLEALTFLPFLKHEAPDWEAHKKIISSYINEISVTNTSLKFIKLFINIYKPSVNNEPPKIFFKLFDQIAELGTEEALFFLEDKASFLFERQPKTAFKYLKKIINSLPGSDEKWNEFLLVNEFIKSKLPRLRYDLNNTITIEELFIKKLLGTKVQEHRNDLYLVLLIVFKNFLAKASSSSSLEKLLLEIIASVQVYLSDVDFLNFLVPLIHPVFTYQTNTFNLVESAIFWINYLMSLSEEVGTKHAAELYGRLIKYRNFSSNAKFTEFGKKLHRNDQNLAQENLSKSMYKQISSIESGLDFGPLQTEGSPTLQGCVCVLESLLEKQIAWDAVQLLPFASTTSGATLLSIAKMKVQEELHELLRNFWSKWLQRVIDLKPIGGGELLLECWLSPEVLRLWSDKESTQWFNCILLLLNSLFSAGKYERSKLVTDFLLFVKSKLSSNLFKASCEGIVLSWFRSKAGVKGEYSLKEMLLYLEGPEGALLSEKNKLNIYCTLVSHEVTEGNSFFACGYVREIYTKFSKIADISRDFEYIYLKVMDALLEDSIDESLLFQSLEMVFELIELPYVQTRMNCAKIYERVCTFLVRSTTLNLALENKLCKIMPPTLIKGGTMCSKKNFTSMKAKIEYVHSLLLNFNSQQTFAAREAPLFLDSLQAVRHLDLILSSQGALEETSLLKLFKHLFSLEYGLVEIKVFQVVKRILEKEGVKSQSLNACILYGLQILAHVPSDDYLWFLEVPEKMINFFKGIEDREIQLQGLRYFFCLLKKMDELEEGFSDDLIEKVKRIVDGSMSFIVPGENPKLDPPLYLLYTSIAMFYLGNVQTLNLGFNFLARLDFERHTCFVDESLLLTLCKASALVLELPNSSSRDELIDSIVSSAITIGSNIKKRPIDLTRVLSVFEASKSPEILKAGYLIAIYGLDLYSPHIEHPLFFGGCLKLIERLLKFKLPPEFYIDLFANLYRISLFLDGQNEFKAYLDQLWVSLLENRRGCLYHDVNCLFNKDKEMSYLIVVCSALYLSGGNSTRQEKLISLIYDSLFRCFENDIQEYEIFENMLWLKLSEIFSSVSAPKVPLFSIPEKSSDSIPQNDAVRFFEDSKTQCKPLIRITEITINYYKLVLTKYRELSKNQEKVIYNVLIHFLSNLYKSIEVQDISLFASFIDLFMAYNFSEEIKKKREEWGDQTVRKVFQAGLFTQESLHQLDRVLQSTSNT